MGWISASISSKRRSPAAGANPSPRAMNGWKAAASPSTRRTAPPRRNIARNPTYRSGPTAPTTWAWGRRNSATASATPSGRSPPPFERAGGGHRHGLRRYGQDALRHGDLRQHGYQRGHARRPEGRRGLA